MLERQLRRCENGTQESPRSLTRDDNEHHHAVRRGHPHAWRATSISRSPRYEGSDLKASGCPRTQHREIEPTVDREYSPTKAILDKRILHHELPLLVFLGDIVIAGLVAFEPEMSELPLSVGVLCNIRRGPRP